MQLGLQSPDGFAPGLLVLVVLPAQVLDLLLQADDLVHVPGHVLIELLVVGLQSLHLLLIGLGMALDAFLQLLDFLGLLFLLGLQVPHVLQQAPFAAFALGEQVAGL